MKNKVHLNMAICYASSILAHLEFLRDEKIDFSDVFSSDVSGYIDMLHSNFNKFIEEMEAKNEKN